MGPVCAGRRDTGRVIRVAAASALALALAVVEAAPSTAAPPDRGESTPSLGLDVSWPQCGDALPTDHAFGIVGVNGGLATTTNPCLAEQLRWARDAHGSTAQEPVQLYVNTANPGGLRTPSWPSSSTAGIPHGACDGGDTLACAWQYGWNRAEDDVEERFAPAVRTVDRMSADPSDFIWWLDVELENTWKTGGSEADKASNRAVLEGMTEHFESRGARVGLYSTAFQWGEIVGTVPESSSLAGLDNWRPGGSSRRNAERACSAAPLTPGGRVVLGQFVSGDLDYNVSCIG